MAFRWRADDDLLLVVYWAYVFALLEGDGGTLTKSVRQYGDLAPTAKLKKQNKKKTKTIQAAGRDFRQNFVVS